MIAIGQFAIGLISVAQIGVGVLFGFGQVIIGLTAVAQFAATALFGVGQIAVGYIAIGQIGFGVYALGQEGFGRYVWSTRAALAAHRERQAEERTLCGSKWQVPKILRDGQLEEIDDLVFTTTIGTPTEGRNVTKRFQKILQDAGIPRHRFHDLRHTAATLLAVQGVHPKAIQGVLGWDQASMVDRHAHFVDEMRKQAAVRMDEALKPLAVSLAVTDSPRKAN